MTNAGFIVIFVYLLSGFQSFAASPDGKTYEVISKMCGTNPLVVVPRETAQFEPGYLYYQETLYTRTIQMDQSTGSTQAGNFYSELSTLSPQLTGSDDVTFGPEIELNLTLHGTEMGARMTGSPECTTGELHLQLTEIQQ